MFDGRSVALGGTGTAYTDNAAAIFLNPAGLEQIDKLSATIDFTPFLFKTEIPLTGPTSVFTSERTFVPLFFAGGAYRVHDQVVMGLALLTPAGFGINLANLPGGAGDLDVTLARFELAIPVSVRLMKDLSLGLEWRGTYMKHTISQSVQAGPAGFVPMDIDLSGTNLTGLAVGLFYKPKSMVRLGLSYRSKVNVGSSGTTTMAGSDMDTTSSWATPHSFRLGTAITLADEKLMLAADVKYQLYDNSQNQLAIVTATPAGDQTTTINLDWNNSLALGLGGEYQVSKLVTLRLGYSLTQSAVPGSTGGFVGPPPGWFKGIHMGAGLAFESFDVDIGGYYMFGTKTVDTGTANNAGPGDYALNSTVLSTSMNYHF